MKLDLDNSFRYFYNGKDITHNITSFDPTNMNVTIIGKEVHYTTPKKQDKEILSFPKLAPRDDEFSKYYTIDLSFASQIEKRKDLSEFFRNEISEVDKSFKILKSIADKQIKELETKEDETAKEERDRLFGRAKSINSSVEKVVKDYLYSPEGIKETEGKTDYSEIDWDFVTQMAERMNTNKGKYPKNNWQRPMDVEKLKQSMLRHVIAILRGEDADDGRELGHYESVALNAMMINYQLKNK